MTDATRALTTPPAPAPVRLTAETVALFAAGLAMTFIVATSLERQLAPLTALFVLVCPGFAVIRHVRLGNRVLELVAAIALSVALAGLIAVVQTYVGAWSPRLELQLLIATTLAALLVDPALVYLAAPTIRRRTTRTGEPAARAPAEGEPGWAATSVSSAGLNAPAAVSDEAPAAQRGRRGSRSGGVLAPPPRVRETVGIELEPAPPIPASIAPGAADAAPLIASLPSERPGDKRRRRRAPSGDATTAAASAVEPGPGESTASSTVPRAVPDESPPGPVRTKRRRARAVQASSAAAGGGEDQPAPPQTPTAGPRPRSKPAGGKERAPRPRRGPPTEATPESAPPAVGAGVDAEAKFDGENLADVAHAHEPGAPPAVEDVDVMPDARDEGRPAPPADDDRGAAPPVEDDAHQIPPAEDDARPAAPAQDHAEVTPWRQDDRGAGEGDATATRSRQHDRRAAAEEDASATAWRQDYDNSAASASDGARPALPAEGDSEGQAPDDARLALSPEGHSHVAPAEDDARPAPRPTPTASPVPRSKPAACRHRRRPGQCRGEPTPPTPRPTTPRWPSRTTTTTVSVRNPPNRGRRN